jgi:hypothetical protein
MDSVNTTKGQTMGWCIKNSKEIMLESLEPGRYFELNRTVYMRLTTAYNPEMITPVGACLVTDCGGHVFYLNSDSMVLPLVISSSNKGDIIFTT